MTRIRPVAHVPLVLLSLPLLLLPLSACSGDGDGGSSTANGSSDGGGGSGNATTAAARCPERCAEKLRECGGDQDQAESACAPICEGMTEARLRCIVGLGCAQIVEELRDQSVCGGSSSGPGNNDGGGGNASCTLGDAPKCDGNKLVTCKEVAGRPVRQSETCESSCKGGKCVPAYEACEPYSVSAAEPCRSPCTVKVTEGGRSYCTAACGPSGACPSGTRCEGSISGICKK